MKLTQRSSPLTTTLLVAAVYATALGTVHAAAPASGPLKGPGLAAACPAGGTDNDLAGPPGATCLGCHDGAIAPNIDAAPLGAASPDAHLHPVGMRYADAAARDPTGFAPEWEVRRVLDLPNGHVQCTSCHVDRPDASRSRRLAHQGDRLCTTCHRK